MITIWLKCSIFNQSWWVLTCLQPCELNWHSRYSFGSRRWVLKYRQSEKLTATITVCQLKCNILDQKKIWWVLTHWQPGPLLIYFKLTGFKYQFLMCIKIIVNQTMFSSPTFNKMSNQCVLDTFGNLKDAKDIDLYESESDTCAILKLLPSQFDVPTLVHTGEYLILLYYYHTM